MKRRNADTGKLRRPLKRTKITEGMYGNSMLYVKFVLLWSSIALADYMLEFRFEFLGPLWLMIKSIYNCYHSKGLAFTVFFTCVALTSDMVCYFIIPMQVLTFLAGVCVWVSYIWITFESKGMCTQTLCMWLVVVYVEALRTGFLTSVMRGALPEEPDEWGAKPWAAGALGFPIISLGVNAKQKLDDRLRLRTQRQVRAQNEFYFKLMREAIPEGGLTTSTYASDLLGELDNTTLAESNKNGAVKVKRLPKSETNGHCVKDKDYLSLKAKLEHLEQYVDKKTRARDSSTQSTQSQKSTHSTQSQKCSQSNQSAHSTPSSPHAPHTNGVAKGPGCDEDKSNHCKGTKPSKYDKKEAAPREDKRKKKHKELDKELVHSHKSTDNATKELIDKEVESTNENVKVKECNNIHKAEEKIRDGERKREKEEEKKREEEKRKEKEEERRRERDEEKKREKERERELKEREKEREKEKEREQELLSARECAAELSRVKAELDAAQRSEAACARQLAACLAGDQQRRAMQADLNAQLQHKMSAWRCSERAALERKLGEERRLRIAADQQLLKARRTSQSECESEYCKSRRSAVSAELATLRKDLQRTRDRLTHAQRDLTQANEKVSALESEKAHSVNATNSNNGGIRALEARAAHLERVLSSETRMKLDLLGALGDANRKMRIHESVIHRQDKELEELKAQMLAVMPPDYVSPTPRGTGRLPASPLDPNASVYTPKQLCSDA